jgi:hypothetical protein
MNIMNIKKTLLILTIATTMCACKDNANTEPNPPEPVLLDTTYIGDTMKVTYKDWVTLDWSLFDSAWAVNDSLRNVEFTIFHRECYDKESGSPIWEYIDTTDVIKNDSAQIKEIFNELWEQHKKDVCFKYSKDSNSSFDWYFNSTIDITLKHKVGVNYRYEIYVRAIINYWANDTLDRKVRVIKW